ncbi:MAG: DUF4262 domain-containing protein [Hyphomonadaceae bacterium]
MTVLNAIEQQMVDGVAEHGWFGMHVMAEGDFPGVSYSIGFWESIGAPEFLIYALPRKLTHSMLGELFRQLKAGRTLTDGGRISDLLEGFDCIVRPMHVSHFPEHVGSALWYRRHKVGNADGLNVWQVFWPGSQQGLFPWEPGCAQEVREDQPLLYLPKETGLA